MTIDVSLLIAGIGCLVGVIGWVYSHDNNTAKDAQWRGKVDAKLDIIVGIRSDVDRIDRDVSELTARVAKAESSASSAHHRIDGLEGKMRPSSAPSNNHNE